MSSKTRRIRRPASATLWYDAALPLKLGCTGCPDLAICGGLKIRAGAFDCRTLCACARGGPCSGVCRRDAPRFVARVREVDGFALDNVPRTKPLAVPDISAYMPVIYDGTNRLTPLDADTVALPLMSLFNKISGAARFSDRAAMLDTLRLSAETRVMVTGVDEDRAIERWWSFHDRPHLIAGLRALGVEMVTGPNYSLFTDVARHDNLHNMKRIALTCAEFMEGGIPCALHVNGRTDTDYRRWAEFISVRDEVSLLSFEFTTGTVGLRGAYHRDHLIGLAESAPRPLHLVLRGGTEHLPALTAAFESVSIVDAEPYIKTKYRRRAYLTMGAGLDWRPSPTAKDEPLDALLRHNIMSKRHSTNLRLTWLRADYGHRKARHAAPLLQARPA